MCPSRCADLTVDTLRAVTGRFADLLGTADPTLAVPSCPAWTVEDLVRHVGEVHAWAAGFVGADGDDDERAPRERLGDWYRGRAAHLADALERAGASAPAQVLWPEGGGRASFWVRRQIHETVMHTWDVRSAHGVDDEIEPTLAWDGVEEVRDVFYPRQVALGRIKPLPAALVLEATDLDRPAVTIGTGEPITLRLSASENLLALWHRGRRTLPGDRAAALLAAAVTP